MSASEGLKNFLVLLAILFAWKMAARFLVAPKEIHKLRPMPQLQLVSRST